MAKHIPVKGIVQGVGFRPYVYGLATRYHLHGWVCNTSGGVEILVEGDREDWKNSFNLYHWKSRCWQGSIRWK